MASTETGLARRFGTEPCQLGFPSCGCLGILATLTRLRTIGLALGAVALAAMVSSLEPAMPQPGSLASASLFAVKTAAARPALTQDAAPQPAERHEPSPVLEPGSSSSPVLPATLMLDVALGAVAGPWVPAGAPDLTGLAAADPLDAAPAVIPGEELDEVRWTVERRMRLEEMATNWGLWVAELRELNPELGDQEWVDAASSFVVHRAGARRRSQSVGAPNRGHLLGGIPLPEGVHWRLREHRPRAYGSRTTITALLAALRAYGAADPSAPPLRIGEISRRAGGRIAPHASHRSGRDVDIGYVMKVNPDSDERFWRTATPKNVDARRTWAFISALIEGGGVQQIFISAKLQPAIAKEAAKTLSREQVALLFSAMNPDPNVHTLVKHESGHRDHMHVRFACEPGNLRCIANSADLAAAR